MLIITSFCGMSLLAFRSTCAPDYFLQQNGLAALGHQMAHALAFLHRLGITHTDVKPDNICITTDAADNIHRFTLIDFGCAVYTHSRRNSYVQSRWYRAPEVMLGAPWGHSIDVWSLGCTLAQMLLGLPQTPLEAQASRLALLVPLQLHWLAVAAAASTAASPS